MNEVQNGIWECIANIVIEPEGGYPFGWWHNKSIEKIWDSVELGENAVYMGFFP